jgi:hypothetical protein
MQSCDNNIYWLTKRQLYDIFKHVIFTKTGTASMLTGIVRFSGLAAVFATKTAKNSGGTGDALLFFARRSIGGPGFLRNTRSRSL